MPLRSSPYALLLLFVGILAIPFSAAAAELDAELGRLMAQKATEPIPVLMIFHDLPTVDRDAVRAETDPRLRRERLLAQLRPAMRRLQAPALDLLRSAEKASGVSRVRELYLAGALAFEAPASVIQALAATDLNATLFYDRTYEFVRGLPGLPMKSYNDDTEPRTAAEALDKPEAVAAPADTAWSLQYIGADRVWDELGFNGAGIVVGHVDSGVDVDHPDLIGRLWTNPGEIAANGLDDDGNGFIDDVHGWDFGADDADPDDNSLTPGHGTHTAGTVVGDGSGGTLTGVAPGATLMAVKVWQDNGSGGTLSMIWAAQQYCVENGARLITMSLGLSGPIAAIYARNDRFNADNLRDAGVALFNSAGNDHNLYDPPIELSLTARIPSPWSPVGDLYSHTSGVITVGGTSYFNDLVYTESSRGPATWGTVSPWFDFPYDPGPGLIKPDIAAPGVGINSTTVGGGYSGDSWSGTSMACPHVAGLAALMLQKNPSLSPAGLDSLLQLHAIDRGPTGKDNDFGAGRIDAYATVQAVPTVLLPNLIAVKFLPDFDSDQVLDPGEAAPVAFRLENVSPIQDGNGVTASLAVVPDPYVSVTDAVGSFPAMTAGGGQAENTSDAFALSIAVEAPQGHEFTLLLTVADASGFQRTFDIPWYVGLPEYRTHDAGNLYVSVTDQGSIGYLSQERSVADGVGYLDGESALYLSSLWVGTDAGYVCNRDFSVDGGDPAEWETVTDPNGRVRDLGTARADQTFQAVFSDAGHASPKPLTVRQTSLAFAGEPNADFVILEYDLINEGPSALDPLYAGVFCDFDVANSSTNEGGTDPSRALTYIYSEGGPYYGVARLGGTAHNLTLISNPIYIYPNLYIEDSFKMRHLSGIISTPVTDQPDDWSALTSVRLNLPANGSDVVAFALVYGNSLADLQANVDAANAVYTTFAPVAGDLPREPVALASATPNPFNPTTEIAFSLDRAGHVDLAVYDLAGRRVRTLVAATRGAGSHHVVWDGRSNRGDMMPSGIYLYRLVAEGRTLSRKMTLLK